MLLFTSSMCRVHLYVQSISNQTTHKQSQREFHMTIWEKPSYNKDIKDQKWNQRFLQEKSENTQKLQRKTNHKEKQKLKGGEMKIGDSTARQKKDVVRR